MAMQSVYLITVSTKDDVWSAHCHKNDKIKKVRLGHELQNPKSEINPGGQVGFMLAANAKGTLVRDCCKVSYARILYVTKDVDTEMLFGWLVPGHPCILLRLIYSVPMTNRSVDFP